MNTIIVSAPGKLMLFGEYAVLEGEPCLTTAVNRRMTVRVTRAKTQQFVLHAKDLKIDNYKRSLEDLGNGEGPKDVRFAETVVRNFFQQFPQKKPGVIIETHAPFSKNFGFGSSAATTVALSYALTTLFSVSLSKKELFDFAYKTVLDVQHAGSGFDIASSLYGGVLYFLSGGKKIEQVKVEDFPLLVGYTGVKADTVSFIQVFNEKKKNNQKLYKDTCHAIGNAVKKAKKTIENENWQEAGNLMNENQRLLSVFSVSTPMLDKLVGMVNKNGAYGAKLSGAGGGDCMIALVSDRKREVVKQAIENAGGSVIDVSVEKEGVRIEK